MPGFEAVAYANGECSVRDGITECFLRFADGDSHGNGQAALPGAAERAVADDLRRQFHVRIGQNDHVIFCAALALHALAARRRARVHMFGDGRGADKTDGANLRMVAERIHHVFPAVHEVHDAFGQAGFSQTARRRGAW